MLSDSEERIAASFSVVTVIDCSCLLVGSFISTTYRFVPSRLVAMESTGNQGLAQHAKIVKDKLMKVAKKLE